MKNKDLKSFCISVSISEGLFIVITTSMGFNMGLLANAKNEIKRTRMRVPELQASADTIED